jgi:transcriptional antiterminator NusG
MLMAEQYWGACRTFTGREHVVRAKIEEMDRGAFLPTFVRSWVADGKLSVAERPAVPGYVFFRASQDDWSPVQDVDSVIGVLANGGSAMRISNDDMARLVIDHAAATHNRFEGCLSSPSRGSRRKSRKPRPSKRARFA